MDKIKAFIATAIAAIKENGKATVIERPFTSGLLVIVGFIVGAVLL